MKQVIKYLRTMFGTNILMEPHSSSNLPIYLTEHYQFYKLQLNDDSYIFIKPKEAIKLNISALKKQLTQIQKHTGLQPVLVFENLRLSQRNALIQAGLAFVVPEKQLFIPQFIMNLSEVETTVEEYGEQFSVATQVVFGYLLLNRIAETNAHQLSERLNYSVAAINRALKELCQRKLLNTVGNGTRKKYIVSDGGEFWERGKQYLFDPVRTQYYVTTVFDCSNYLCSNDLALSQLSSLSGKGISYYATSTQDVKKIDKQCLMKEYDIFDQNYCVVEVFRYDPQLLSNSKHIDVISLFAQFKHSREERVQIEIESLINKVLASW